MSLKKIFFVIVVAFLSSVTSAQTYRLEGRIATVFAGADDWYGVRFYLSTTFDNTGENCNSQFAYSEPDEGNGHDSKVAVFLAGYMAGKDVVLTVVPGRNGYCKISEGSITN